jgi:D-lactate dehydrogenase (cytochrome)
MLPSTLTQLFDKRQLATDPAELITYEIDAGFDRGRPDAVFYPESTADVSRIMAWAQTAGMPLVARGAGTGLSGGAVAEHGGVIVELARMNRVLELDAAVRSAVVQPGVVNLALDTLVRQQGLYYPPDPSSGRSSVIGGNIGENAGGPHCFKYGVTTNYVTGLEVVLAGGQVVRLGGRSLDYPELDFCGLLVGSEGTLGIVTEANVRLIRNPPAVKTMMVAFETIGQAGAAVSSAIAAGLVPATLEMMDRRVMRMIEAYAPVGLPVDAGAALIVEVDGHPASLDTQMEEIADILTAHGGFNLRLAQSEAERAQIWYGRKSAAGAFSRLAPNFYLVDITVPRSRLAETLVAVDEVCDRYSLEVGHVFHAGDGNLHPCILFDARDADLKARVFQACDEIVALCVARDGSITGEHGVGIEKRAYMPMMYSGAELAAMREIKELLDPHHLLNPGKIFPAELPASERMSPRLPDGFDPAADAPVLSPASAEEAAAALAALSAAGRSVRIGGAPQGERQGAHIWLSASRLQGIHTYAPDDLYVTAGAGTPLVELQAFLHERQMQVPLAAPWPQATLGGLVAANLNAPLRMRYSSLRDLLLCTKVAMADGRIIRAGRPVVKNVAGYDLPKLFVGSHGVLGLLVDVTLKLTPPPRARRTLCIPVEELAQGLRWAAATARAWLLMSGVVLCQGAQIAGAPQAPYMLLLTAEGLAEDIAAELDEMAQALRSAGAPAPVEVETHTATGLWGEFIATTTADELLARVGVPSNQLLAYWSQLPAAVREATVWFYDAANSLAYAVYAPENADGGRAWLQAIRTPALALGGYAVVMQAPSALDREIDVWGYAPSALPWMRQLKTRWDPAGILNPGGLLA